MRNSFPHRSSAEVAKILGIKLIRVARLAHKLGLRKTPEYLATPASGRIRPGSTIGLAGRFMPEHVPANKGLHRPGYSKLHGRMAETTFKKGQRARNYLPIGTVRKDSYGYLRIKIADGPGGDGNPKVWAFVHRKIWEDAHGPIPKGHRIWWKDRNHENCALENLELLTDKEHMARTTIHNLPEALKNTIMLAGSLKRRIRRLERGKGQAERTAKSSIRNHRAA